MDTTTSVAMEADLDNGHNVQIPHVPSIEATSMDITPSWKVEDSMQQPDLSLLVSQMMIRIESLESELRDTKKLYAQSFITLTQKVKDLENYLGAKKKKRRVVITESDEEVVPKGTIYVTPEKVKTSGEVKEGISPNTLEAALVLSKVDIKNPTSTYKRRGRLMLDQKKHLGLG